MSITFDGHRSLMRKHFAKRALANARDMGLPSSTTKRDGFMVRVTNLDPDLEMGRVTAPAGAVVACSTRDGVQIASADYFLGGFNPARPAYILEEIESSPAEITSTIQGVTGSAYARVIYDPPIPADPPTYTEPEITTPVVSSFIDENYVYAITGRHKTAAMLYHQGSSFYPDSGSAEKSLLFSTGSSRPLIFTCTTTIPSDGGFSSFVAPIEAWHLVTGDKPYIVGRAYRMTGSGQVSVGTLESRIAYSSFPLSVRNALSYYDMPISGHRPYHIRTYGFCLKELSETSLPTTMQLVGAEHIPFPPLDDSPEYDLMLPIINWSDGISGIIVHTSGIRAFCNDVFGDPDPSPPYNYGQLVEKMLYFFGYPCARGRDWTPPDSMLIPTDDNTVFAWTRDYGVARFSAVHGLQKVISGFDVPALVTGTAGMRPNITKSDATHYFCVCEDTATGSVMGLYSGSPFSTWDEVPMPDDGELLHARPIRNAEQEVIVLGVLLVAGVHYFAFLHYVDNGSEWTGSWKKAGELPFEVTGSSRWSVCLYGNDPWVSYQQSYLQPPSVVHGDVS